jgi:hypothetical protein
MATMVTDHPAAPIGFSVVDRSHFRFIPTLSQNG